MEIIEYTWNQIIVWINALAMIGIFSHFFYKQYKILKEDEEKESKRK